MRTKIDAQKARIMYEQGATVKEVADYFGVSRVAIWKAWKRVGYSTDGLRFQVPCAECGKELQRQRAIVLKTKLHYCSRECYQARIQRLGAKYVEWRQGQRRARKRVSQHFALSAGMIVHHVDGDSRNNELANLWIFASQADHMSYHRGGEAKPIWKGGLPQ